LEQPLLGRKERGKPVRDDHHHETELGICDPARRRHSAVAECAPSRPTRERHLHTQTPRDVAPEQPVLEPVPVDRAHHFDRARLEHGGCEAEQGLVEPAEVRGRAAHTATRLDLCDEVRLIVVAVDVVRRHFQPAVGVDYGHGVAAPVDRRDPFSERGLLIARDAHAQALDAERSDDLIAHVPVDRTTVDALDDRAEDLPAARRVVGGGGARLPASPGRGNARHDVVVGHVAIEELGVRVRETARVREDVADRAALLARAPAVDVVADEVVEAELALLPQLQHRDHRQGLAGRVQQHEVVGLEGAAGARLAHGGLEEDLASQRHVALGAVVPAVRPLPLEDVDHTGEVGLRRAGDGHGLEPRTGAAGNCLTPCGWRVAWADVSQPRAQAEPDK
jgi:hypothetical protein